MEKSTRTKTRVLEKKDARSQEQPLLEANPEAVLPMLEMMSEARLCLDDVLGELSHGLIEAVLMCSAQSVAGEMHPGRRGSEVRWHGQQGGIVSVGHAKLRVQRPRLRDGQGEVPIPVEAIAGPTP